MLEFEAAPFLATVVLLAAGGLIYFLWRYSGDFQIIVSGNNVTYRGRFPPARRGDTTLFLLNDVVPPGRVRIIGTWSARHVLHVRVRGNLDTGRQQQIRNFLKVTLKG